MRMIGMVDERKRRCWRAGALCVRRQMFHDEVIADDRHSVGKTGKVKRAPRKGARGEIHLYSKVFAPACDMKVLDIRNI